jgi:hypothetical protein
MMPLLYVDKDNEKNIEEDARAVLDAAHDDIEMLRDASNRMKPLDVVKVLMGIFSSRECVKRFQY